MTALSVYSRRKRARRAGLVALCFIGSLSFVPQAMAQSITPSHLRAARSAVAVIHATDQFDSFLPDTALAMKNELSRRDPNLAPLISKTVDEQTMKLISRRADLEKEVARVYAKHFTEAELNQIAQFYGSETGKKLLKEGPASMAESVGAYEIWRQGVAQDLASAVGKALDEKLAAEPVKNPPALKGTAETAPGLSKEKPKAALNFGK